MGKSYTPTYRVHLVQPGYMLTPAAWRVRAQGRYPGNGAPTDANLARYVQDFEASTQPGGCNAHLGRSYISSARIVRQSTGTVVATYKAPMFKVVS